MKRGRRREILPASEERAEKGDLTREEKDDLNRQLREGGQVRSYQTVKRGRRREFLPGSEERAEKRRVLTRQ